MLYSTPQSSTWPLQFTVGICNRDFLLDPEERHCNFSTSYWCRSDDQPINYHEGFACSAVSTVNVPYRMRFVVDSFNLLLTVTITKICWVGPASMEHICYFTL